MSYTKDRSLQTHAFIVKTEKLGSTGKTTITRALKKFKIFRTRTGDANPNWRKNIMDHVNATTAMSGVLETLMVRPLSASMTTVAAGLDSTWVETGLHSAYQYLPSTDTHPALMLDPATARNRAMSKALKQVRSAQISMSGGTFLGEFGEAIHMLRHPAEGLRKALQTGYLDKLKKIKKAQPDKWKKAISQTWLEGCFGWRPFINDLEDAAKAYEEIRKRKTDEYKKIKATGKDQQLISLINDSGAPLSDLYIKSTGKVWEDAICVIRGEVKSLAVTTPLDKARVFGLTPSEFMPTVWELLPWSFLADYFTNIGDIIENSCTDQSSLAWLEMSVIRRRTQEVQSITDFDRIRSLHPANLKAISGSPDYMKYERRLVSRTVPTSLSVPPLMFELPGSPIKQFNMLALWTQANSISSQDSRKLRGRSFR